MARAILIAASAIGVPAFVCGSRVVIAVSSLKVVPR
jgi:hypothetical protein